jgi:glycosyltransferase involved in cell wall biosynthesis
VLNREDYKKYRQWGLDNIFLIPNGVDTKRFIPLQSKDHSEFKVLFVGRLDSQKGIDILLEAIVHLERKIPQEASKITFQICGIGPMSGSVNNFAENRPNVNYLGYVSDENLLHLYKSASIFLMPSRRETFGLAAMEAMASGTPIITSNIPGPRTFVRQDFGRMVPPGNPAALAESIYWFHQIQKNDLDQLHRMEQKARDICVKEYDWEHVTDRIADMVKSVAELKE